MPLGSPFGRKRRKEPGIRGCAWWGRDHGQSPGEEGEKHSACSGNSGCDGAVEPDRRGMEDTWGK